MRLITILSLLLSSQVVLSKASEEAQVLELIKLYEAGECQAAAKGLKGLLYPLKLKDKALECQARQYLAFTYFLLGEKEKAIFEFVKLLRQAPKHRLDPNLVLPEIAKAFEEAKRIHAFIIEEAKSYPPRVETIIKPGPEVTVVNFLPAGLPQFENKQPLKGYLLLTAQLVSFGASVVFYGQVRKQYHPKYGGPLDKKQAEQAQQLMRITFGSGLFFYLLSVVDGLFSLNKVK
jgi:hypothetical protein